MLSVGGSLCICLALLVVGTRLPGTHGADSDADIRLPPSIIEGPPKSLIYVYTEEVELPCVATGSPRPTYTWTFKGNPLELNVDGIRMSTEDGTLTIESATFQHAGVYQCFASNDHGKTMSSHSTLTQSTIGNYPANVEVHQYIANAGAHAKIACQYLNSVPAATITWSIALSKNDKTPLPLQTGKRINIDESGNLHFAFLKTTDERDGKLYRCNHYNGHLKSRVGGSDSMLKVNPGPTVRSAPQVEAHSDDVKVGLVGGTISLKCLFSGNPVPTVSWSRVNGDMPSSPRGSASGESGTLLVITQLREDDEGEYKCRGTNSQGSSEHIMKIDIQSEPTFEVNRKHPKRPVNVNVTEGDNYSFICDPHAEPAAEITWYRNGEELDVWSPGPERHISNDEKNFTLYNTCKTCQDGNSLMNVQCMAKNKHGSVIADGYLNVLMPTVIVTPPETAELVYGESVNFKCEAKSDDSTPITIKWVDGHQVEVAQKVDRIWVNEDDNSLQIETGEEDDLGAHYADTYMCIATNTYSSANASADLLLPPGPIPSPQPSTAGSKLWLIFVIIAIILLLLIILLCCCICLQRNRGDEYSVDEKERKNGNDPEKELKDNGFQDYQRPEEQPMKGSRASLSSTIKLGESDDEGSLAEYGDIDTGKFNEDGSFLGLYHNDKKKQGMDSTV